MSSVSHILLKILLLSPKPKKWITYTFSFVKLLGLGDLEVHIMGL